MALFAGFGVDFSQVGSACPRPRASPGKVDAGAMNRWNGPAESAGLTGWFTTLIFCRAARPASGPGRWQVFCVTGQTIPGSNHHVRKGDQTIPNPLRAFFVAISHSSKYHVWLRIRWRIGIRPNSFSSSPGNSPAGPTLRSMGPEACNSVSTRRKPERRTDECGQQMAAVARLSAPLPRLLRAITSLAAARPPSHTDGPDRFSTAGFASRLAPASLLGRGFGLARLPLTVRWGLLADRWEKWRLCGLGHECWPPTFGLFAKDAGKVRFSGEQEPESLDTVELAGFKGT